MSVSPLVLKFSTYNVKKKKLLNAIYCIISGVCSILFIASKQLKSIYLIVQILMNYPV